MGEGLGTSFPAPSTNPDALAEGLRSGAARAVGAGFAIGGDRSTIKARSWSPSEPGPAEVPLVDLQWPMTDALEEHARRADPTIQRLPLSLMRENPALRRHVESFGVPPWDLWGYTAPADGPWPERRLVAIFKRHPAKQDPADALPRRAAGLRAPVPGRRTTALVPVLPGRSGRSAGGTSSTGSSACSTSAASTSSPSTSPARAAASRRTGRSSSPSTGGAARGERPSLALPAVLPGSGPARGAQSR